MIYDTVYPGPEWAPVSFEEAERLETVHYRQAVAAALLARPVLDRSRRTAEADLMGKRRKG